MAKSYPTNQKFEKLSRDEKYRFLLEARDTALSRREHHRKYWKSEENRKQINKNFMKAYNKLEEDIGVYSKGDDKGKLKQITNSMSNKKLNAMYASYNTFLKTDIYSAEGRKIKQEQTKNAMEKLKQNKAFESLSDDTIKNMYDFYNRIGRDIISQYGSESAKDLYNQYQELGDVTIMETMEDVISDSVDKYEAVFKVHKKLLPKILDKKIKKWQKELDNIGYEDYSAKDLVKLVVDGKAPGFERIKYTDPEDIAYFFKLFINQNK